VLNISQALAHFLDIVGPLRRFDGSVPGLSNRLKGCQIFYRNPESLDVCALELEIDLCPCRVYSDGGVDGFRAHADLVADGWLQRRFRFSDSLPWHEELLWGSSAVTTPISRRFGLTIVEVAVLE
jgi:hypothetical protein